jgi:hypothetical protein
MVVPTATAGVDVEARLRENRLLEDEVEPVVGKARAELFFAIASRELDVERGAECGSVRPGPGRPEIPFDTEVGIAQARGGGNNGAR